MAAPKSSPKSKATPASKPIEKWPFGRKNYIWFGISLVVMILGYVLLSQGSTSWAPLFLVIAYCVLVPIAILIKDSPRSEPTESTGEPIA
jgi:hypothetical protein